MKPSPARTRRGFTLVEVLVAVVIAGVLAMVAYPAFLDSIRKSRRSDAFAALSAVQQAQERLRSTRSEYAGNALLAASPTADPPGLGLSNASPDRHYGIALADASATGYTASATAVSGSSQARDAGCQVLAVRMASGNLSYGSGASSVDWTDPKRCWAR